MNIKVIRKIIVKQEGGMCMKYDKWPLQYRYSDLEPYIDRETVCIHYTKHL